MPLPRCEVPGRGVSYLLRNEQPPILIDAVDRRVFIPRGLAVGDAFLIPRPCRVPRHDRARRGGVARSSLGGIGVVVQAPRTEATSQFVSGVEALNEDRRRAGRWDREQLIGGKAIEPRK